MSRKKPLRSWTDDDPKESKQSSSLYFDPQPHIIPAVVSPNPLPQSSSHSSNTSTAKPTQSVGMFGLLHSAVSVGVSLFVPGEETEESTEDSFPTNKTNLEERRDSLQPHPMIMMNDKINIHEEENSEDDGSEDDDLSVYFDGMDDISLQDISTPQASGSGQSLMGFLHRAVLQVAGVESTESAPDIEWWSDHQTVLVGNELSGDDEDSLVAEDQEGRSLLSYREMYGVPSSIWDIEEEKVEKSFHRAAPRVSEAQHNLTTLSDEDLENSPEHASNDGLNLGIFKYAFQGIKTVIDVQDDIRSEISQKTHSISATVPTPPRYRNLRYASTEDLASTNFAPRHLIPINPKTLLHVDQFWDREHTFTEICTPHYWLHLHSPSIFPVPSYSSSIPST